MLIEPEISGTSIVLVGSLNPAIFTPDWFTRHELLTVREAETADVQIIHKQIAQFRIDWLDLQVETERFNASTTQEPAIQLRDFVVRTFKEFLPQTPISRMGINRQVHFKVASQGVRDQIGYTLAPPEAWGDWAAKIKSGEKESHGGVVSLVMQQENLDDRPNGYIRATVQPSNKIDGMTGIYVQVNDHYEVQNPETVAGCDEIVEILESNFDKSVRRSEWIIDQIMRLKDD